MHAKETSAPRKFIAESFVQTNKAFSVWGGGGWCVSKLLQFSFV